MLSSSVRSSFEFSVDSIRANTSYLGVEEKELLFLELPFTNRSTESATRSRGTFSTFDPRELSPVLFRSSSRHRDGNTKNVNCSGSP